jgi:hypothetical protein
MALERSRAHGLDLMIPLKMNVRTMPCRSGALSIAALLTVLLSVGSSLAESGGGGAKAAPSTVPESAPSAAAGPSVAVAPSAVAGPSPAAGPSSAFEPYAMPQEERARIFGMGERDVPARPVEFGTPLFQDDYDVTHYKLQLGFNTATRSSRAR